VAALNAFVVRVADLLLAPLSALPPWAGVTLAALATALGVLAVVRLTSDQKRLAAVKRQIQADLFEMRLFNDDLRALLRAQAAVLRHNATYLRLSFVPLLCTAVPLALAIAQLQAYYGYGELPAGVPTHVTATLADPAAAADARLSGDGVRVDGGSMYFPSRHEVVWRVVPAADVAMLRLDVHGATYEKSLVTGPGLRRRSPVRPSANVWDQLLEPSEPPLPGDSAVSEIRVPYPETTIDVLGVSAHWLVWYLVTSFVFVLALRKPLGVVI
jgi:uncharacterized membrane protein (DUF106 family)